MQVPRSQENRVVQVGAFRTTGLFKSPQLSAAECEPTL
jgi:hypothetical protein